MLRKICLGILLATMAGSASAHSDHDLSCHTEYFLGFIPYEECTVKKGPGRKVAAPEINASSAIAGLTLMIGGLAVLRGRRTNSAKT